MDRCGPLYRSNRTGINILKSIEERQRERVRAAESKRKERKKKRDRKRDGRRSPSIGLNAIVSMEPNQ